MGPDFIGIGQQKAGSTWLYDQLKYHPGLWLAPVKELHYLDGRFPHKAVLKFALLAADPVKANRLEAYGREQHRPLDERDMVFFADARAAQGEPHSLDAYAALFRNKGEQLAGEVTPTYCRLEEDEIRALVQRFPDIRILFTVRDPIDRVWSQISMMTREERFKPKLLNNPRKFAEYLKRPIYEEKSFGVAIARRWLSLMNPANLHTIVFDDIVNEPKATIAGVFRFLGVDSGFEGPLPIDLNRQGNREKLELTDQIRAVLVEHFAAELRESAEMFGGAASDWPRRYGL